MYFPSKKPELGCIQMSIHAVAPNGLAHDLVLVMSCRARAQQ